jgi:indolepyruvate ferredoxin oxidoreductase
VTVEGGQLRKKAKSGSAAPSDMGKFPEPAIPQLTSSAQAAAGQTRAGAWGIIVAGVGGTGVITIGQLLGVAAHLEGKGVVTQDAGGLAQKGGATWSHVLIAAAQDDIRTTRVSMASADLVIGCDPVVVAGKETVLRMRHGRTHVALNSHSAPTAAFVSNANWINPGD